MNHGRKARKYALQTARPWTEREHRLAVRMRPYALHIGQVAEKLGRTVMDVTTELGLGAPECAASARYRG